MVNQELQKLFEGCLIASGLGDRLSLDWVGDCYVDPITQGVWILWWKARSDIEVQLPNSYDYLLGIGERVGYKKAIDECQVRLEALGLTVSTMPVTDLGKELVAYNLAFNVNHV